MSLAASLFIPQFFSASSGFSGPAFLLSTPPDDRTQEQTRAGCTGTEHFQVSTDAEKAMTEQEQIWKAPGALRRAHHERGAFLPKHFFSDVWHTTLLLIALVAMAPSLAESPAPSTPAAQSAATVP